MIDTLKLGIPLTHSQFRKLRQRVSDSDFLQWVLLNPISGELKFTRIRGLLQLNNPSFHREVRWDVPDSWDPQSTYLILELSIPKYWYGHNVRLLYDFMAALTELKRELDRQLRCRLPEPDKWELFRVDFCYAWDLGSEKNAKLCLESLKHLHFPRKKPHIYDSSIMFAGNTYSIKFYRKHPEFRQHDLPALLKSEADLAWVEHWERLSKPIVRYEATLRRKYLKRAGITTVADLQQGSTDLYRRGDFPQDERLANLLTMLILFRYMACDGVSDFDGMMQKLRSLDSGAELLEPAGLLYVYVSQDDVNFTVHTGLLDDAILQLDLLDPDPLATPVPCWRSARYPGGRVFRCDGSRSLILVRRQVSEIHLEKFLTKFLGENRGMQQQDQVQALLIEKYSANKAANLYAFWLLARNVGTARAKEMLGDRTFYRRKSDLKKAGVSLVEPLKIVGGTDAEVLKEFEFKIPSIHVSNRVDDYRDSESVINLDEQRLRRLFESG